MAKSGPKIRRPKRSSPELDAFLTAKFAEPHPRKGDLRRVEIIRFTIELVAREGLDEFSLDGLARAMGLSRSHVVYYFADRRSLFLAAARYCILTLQELTVGLVSAGKAENAEALLRAAAIAPIRWLGTYPGQASFLLGAYQLGASFPEMLALLTDFRRVGLERLVALLLRSTALRGAEAERAAKQFHGLITGHFIEAATSTMGLSLADYEELCFVGAKLLATKC